jgi:hypothetical protein
MCDVDMACCALGLEGVRLGAAAGDRAGENRVSLPRRREGGAGGVWLGRGDHSGLEGL